MLTAPGKHHILSIVIILCVSYSFCYSQNKLLPGDSLPNVEVRIYNTSNLIPLNAYKGRVLLIDFWNVWCSSCLSSIPKLERLQRMFPNDISIIFVTSDDSNKVKLTLNRSQYLKNTSLPIVIKDTVLRKLFPYQTVPTIAWVDKKGIFQTTSAGSFLDSSSVADAIAGNFSGIKLKDEIVDFSFSESLFSYQYSDSLFSPLQYSTIFGHLNTGFSGFYSVPNPITKETDNIKAVNITLFEFYRQIFTKGKGRFHELGYFNRFIISPEILKSFQPPNNQHNTPEGYEWFNKNSYCYEIKIPNINIDGLYKRMKEDFDSYFGLKSEVGSYYTDCMALIVSNPKLVPKKSQSVQSESIQENLENYKVANKTLNQSIVSILNYNLDRKINLPIVNLSGIDYPLDISISGKIDDINNVKLQLNKYGFDLVVKKANLEMIKISPKRSL